MLSTLLPGIRELRVPLIVGYLWLLVLWLLFGQALLQVPSAGGPIGRVQQLATYVGRPGTLAALSLTAYLLGSTVSVDRRHKLFWRFSRRGRSGTVEEFLDWANSQSADAPVDRRQLEQLLLGQARRFETKLLVANERLYGDFDRLRSEAELRLNIAPPLAALSAILTVHVNLAFSALLIVPVVLILDGISRLKAGHDVVLQSLMAGVVKTDLAADLKK